jgi:hypothetical protein
MKYYCEILEGVVINTGTFDTEVHVNEGELIYEITKQDYENIDLTKTLLSELTYPVRQIKAAPSQS